MELNIDYNELIINKLITLNRIRMMKLNLSVIVVILKEGNQRNHQVKNALRRRKYLIKRCLMRKMIKWMMMTLMIFWTRIQRIVGD